MNSNLKIKPEDFNGLDVSSLPDQPALTAAELKARFDSPAKVVVADKFNRLIDAVSSWNEGDSGAHLIGSAPVDGVFNENGEHATVLHDQISALQKNITAVVNNEIPVNSLEGSKIIDGTVAAGKLEPDIQPYLEMPVAPGENLVTPCVVTLGKDGVETLKPVCLQGMKNYWGDNQFPSGDNILYNPVIRQLFDNFVIFSYCKYVSANNLTPVVAIGKLENNFLIPVTTIHTGSSIASGTAAQMITVYTGNSVWLLGFTDPSTKTTYIYAFKFDGSNYEYISNFVGNSGIAHENGRFLVLTDNTIIVKSSNSGLTYLTAVKFTGTGFIAGSPVQVHNAEAKYDMVKLSDSRFLIRTAQNAMKVISVDDTSFTVGPIFTYISGASGSNANFITAVSENRIAYYFQPAEKNMSCSMMDIDGYGNITAGPYTSVFSFDYYSNFVVLPNNYVLFIYYTSMYSTGLKMMSLICKSDVSGGKVISVGAWPLIAIGTGKADQLAPQSHIGVPYLISATQCTNTENVMMKFGFVEYSSVFQKPGWAGVAVSQKDGQAKVLMREGIVGGFSGLKPGTVYSIGYNGQLCAIKNHPMSIDIGIAVSDTELWFSGIK